MKNIVLTGFMASGKSTVGKELSKITKRAFIDTDELIEEEAGMTVSDIFQNFGEKYFRDLETIACQMAGEEDGIIIATGGGAVLREENIQALKKNGIIFNLQTDESLIAERLSGAKEGRPLMQAELFEVIERFTQRKAFYERCDYKIPVYGGRTPLEIAGEILKLFEVEEIKSYES